MKSFHFYFFLLSLSLSISNPTLAQVTTLSSIDCNSLLATYGNTTNQEASIILERQVSPGIYSKLGQIRNNANLSSCSFTDITTEGYYRVVVIFDEVLDINDVKLWDLNSNKSQDLFHTCSANKRSEKQLRFDIYPNPNSGILNIKLFESYESWMIRIIDSSGRVIQKNQNVLSIDTSNFLPGVYTIEIIIANDKQIKRFTVIK